MNTLQLSYMFYENNESLELSRDFKDEACVVPKSLNISLIAGVDKNWTLRFAPPLVYKT